MIIAKDLNTATLKYDFSNEGTMFVKYSVRALSNVRNLKLKRSYLITCTQRITIPNTSGLNNPGPEKQNNQLGYFKYPVQLLANINLQLNSSEKKSKLYDYRLVAIKPRTLNSSINVSQNLGVNNSQGASSSSGGSSGQTSNYSHTSGSSTSTTNSYSLTAHIDYPLGGGVSGTYSHEHSSTSDHSATYGGDKSRGSNYNSGVNSDIGMSHDDGDSMSIKDWGSFSRADNKNQGISWVWHQEFPWDVTKIGNIDQETNKVTLPDYALDRLFDYIYTKGKVSEVIDVRAPSSLSQAGLDFTMSCVWEVDEDDAFNSDDELSITPIHYVQLNQASHGVAGTNLPASGNPSFVDFYSSAFPGGSIPGPVLDLALLALGPITKNGGSNGAVVGFTPRNFSNLISQNKNNNNLSFFKIISNSNNLLITGSNFNLPSEVESPNSTFSATIGGSNDSEAQLNVSFKLTESSYPLFLFIKSWVEGEGIAEASECKLSFYFNPDGYNPPSPSFKGQGSLPSAPDLVKYINTSEGNGADDDLLAIDLRNEDYSSVNYHDYLIPGVNNVYIKISSNNKSNVDYFLRAIAIGS